MVIRILFSSLFLLFSCSIYAQLVSRQIGSSPNVYTETNSGTHTVMADPSLNTVVYIHRNNPAVHGGTSGQFRYDLSTNGGQSFTSNIGPLHPSDDPVNRSGRFPNVTITNSPGNTNPSNAYLAFMGGYHNFPAGGDWQGFVSGVARLNNTVSSRTERVFNFNNGDVFAPVSMWNANGTLWAVDWNSDGSDYVGILVYKGVSTTQPQVDYNWNLNQRLFLQFDRSVLPNAQAAALSIAFDPSGQTGWIAFTGDITAGGDAVYQPHFYNTVDGGNTWTGPLTVDLEQLGAITCNLDDPLTSKPSTTFEGALTVDANGKAHYVIAIASQTSDYAVNSARGDMAIYDITSTSATPQTNWRAIHLDNIDELRMTHGDVSVDLRPQCTRSADGTKIFFSWTHYESNQGSASPTNMFADFKTVGINVSNARLTSVRNFTGSNFNWGGLAFYPSCSPIALGTGSTYEIPTVFAELTGSDLNRVNFHYIDNLSFNNSDFNIPFAVPELQVNASPTRTICPNAITQISANASCADGPYTYNWSPTLGLSRPTAGTTLANPTFTTEYRVTVTDRYGNTKVDTVAVIVENCEAEQLCLDYDRAEANNALDPANDYLYDFFSWKLNSAYGTSDIGTLNWAAVVYDSLFNSGTMTGMPFTPATTITVDSVAIVFGHWNEFGTTDTLRFRLLSVAPDGSPGTTTYWEDELITRRSLSDGLDSDGNPQLTQLTLTPDVVIPTGSAFTFRLDFSGDTSSSQFFVLSTFGDACQGTDCGVNEAFIPDNSWYFGNWGTFSSGPQNVVPNNCTGGGTCQQFFIQNFVFKSYITLDDPALTNLNVSINPNPVTICRNEAEVVNVIVSGGNPPYAYQWNTSNGISDQTSGSPTINPSQSTQYQVLVTDQAGASQFSTVVVNVSPGPSISGTVQNESGPFAADGSIDITVSGGARPYSYSWSNGQGSEDVFNLATDDYTITVTDANGCAAEATFSVTGTDFETITFCETVVVPGNGGQAIVNEVFSPSGNWDIYSMTTIGTAEVTEYNVFLNNQQVYNGHFDPTHTTNQGFYDYQNPPERSINPPLPVDPNDEFRQIAILSNNGNSDVNAQVCVLLRYIDNSPDCAAPTNPTHSGVQQTLATLEWDAVAGAQSYKIRGNMLGRNGYLTVNVPASPQAFRATGLSANTCYFWQIQTVCDGPNGVFSFWSEIDTFCTQCAMPGSISTSNITATSARLNWSPVSGVDGFEVRGRAENGNWVRVPVNNPNATSLNTGNILTSRTRYEWQVRTLCDDGRSSSYTALIQFITPSAKTATLGEGIRADESGSTINIKPNPFSQKTLIDFGVPIERGMLRIHALDGSLHKQIEINNEHQLTIERGEMSAGAYILSIEHEKIERFKLIVQ